MDVWDKISAVMKEKKVTAASLSRVTGITQGNFSGWKKKEYQPSAEAVLKISEALGVPVSQLYGENQSSISPSQYILSTEEANLIDSIRSAEHALKEAIYTVANAALSLHKKEKLISSSPSLSLSPKDEKISHRRTERPHYKLVEGKAAAGLPINSISDKESRISVPAKYLSERYFIVQAQGDSMIGAHINDGDFCVFQNDAYFDNGCIMLVQLDGSSDDPDVTIKRVQKQGDCVYLHSENPLYPPMRYAADQVQLKGVLVDIIAPD